MSEALAQLQWLRQLAIADAYARGENTAVIAARFAISRQRVEQIARKHGLPLRAPQKRPTAAKPVPCDQHDREVARG